MICGNVESFEVCINLDDFTLSRLHRRQRHRSRRKKRMAKTKRLEWCIVYFINSLVESKKTQEGDEAGDGAGDEAGVALEAFFTIKPA